VPTTTRNRLAGQLRKLADTLDAADSDVPIRASLNITPDYDPDQTSRVTTVDRLAALFGLTGRPAKNAAAGWYHEASDERDGVRLWVYTYIDSPPRRCACGAVCAHTGGAG
jgi:hypothetical protein